MSLLDPYNDAALVGEKEEEVSEDEDAFKLDYLASFLPNPKSRKLSKVQATEARAACLKVPFWSE